MNQPPPLPQNNQAQPCGLATASLVLGIASLFFWIVGGIPAIVTGHLARKRIHKANATLTGDGLAIAGLILGYASTVLGSIIVVLAVAGFFAGMAVMNRADKITSEASARALEAAVNNFHTEYGSLPDVPYQVTTDAGEGVKLLNVLLGLEPDSDRMQNQRSIKLLSAKETKTKSRGLLYHSSGRTAEGFYDSWGNPFTVQLDIQNEDCLRVSLGDKITILNGRKVAVFSPGADKKFGTADDIKSW
ncbi:MAG: DUF4190 domain-containing protein [Verrucomicrobia bacterium]|nr:DUF4190 domain-containing protein [Verrucomicrobiota bacterium]